MDPHYMDNLERIPLKPFALKKKKEKKKRERKCVIFLLILVSLLSVEKR